MKTIFAIMLCSKELTSIRKFISLVLRHKPATIGTITLAFHNFNYAKASRLIFYFIYFLHVGSDIAIVYGAGDKPGTTFEQRVKSWRAEHSKTLQMA